MVANGFGSASRGRGAAICATIVLGLSLLCGSSVRADGESEALAPWQAPCSEWSDPNCGGCGDCDSCGDGNSCGTCIGNPFFCGVDLLSNRLWFSGEYLAWWTKSASLPALATTSPSGTAYEQAGVLRQPGTTVLFGGSVDPGIHSGARFDLGYWLFPCRDIGIEAVYTFLGSKSVDFSQTSDGGVILARPFYNVQTPAEDSVVLAYPDEQSGSIHVRDSNDVNTFELLLRRGLIDECDRRLDLLVGYRYGRYREDLSIASSTEYISEIGIYPVGTTIDVSDQFSANNEFNGAEVGFSSKAHCCRFSMELLAKLAMGSMRSRVNIGGSTTITEPDVTPATYSSGMLASGTNKGVYEQTRFAVIPELGVTLGYDITCRLRATLGYTVTYWSQVARPGDQIDVALNSSQFPPGTLSGLASPQLRYTTSDFWTQGINAGIDYRF